MAKDIWLVHALNNDNNATIRITTFHFFNINIVRVVAWQKPRLPKTNAITEDNICIYYQFLYRAGP